ncbi:JmjC domain-containing protein [Micromonospora sp. RP3T]|uniref:JmjC domain-containing protein n=1 Tax=Micromonospora sp. RP3T TaxID=2135446 RepID=UPI003D720C75
MYTPTFAELAGDETQFFAHHFNQAPLLRREALSEDPRSILSIADLDGLLHLEALRPPYLGVTVDGQATPLAAYTAPVRVQGAMVTDVVVPERVYELFRTGATVTWSSAEQLSPSLRALTAVLAERFSARSSVTAFLTPAGRQGFSPHHDPIDVFVIQVEGTKHWKLWETLAPRKETFGHYRIDELGEPAFEAVLEPGDVLYMPYNTPHVAVAEDRVSLHLSVSVQPRLWRDVLAASVRRLLDSGEYGDAARPDEAALARFAARLDQLDAAAELRRLIDSRELP